MRPKSLSASAGLTYEGCSARYNAEYILKTPDMSGSAAGLGSACHEALEMFIQGGHHLTATDFTVLANMYAISYYVYFSDRDRYDEGLKMLKDWFDRQDWNRRTVLSTELKETFDLKFYVGPERVPMVVPFTYIWDRCDRIDNEDGTFDIEVVDYKTVFAPISPEEMEKRIQPRAYGLAAQIKYPQARRIKVVYDLLRYDRVGTVFDREDNIATWKYLQQLAERIWNDDGTTEKLNPECRYCVRKSSCETLNKHRAGGGGLTLASFEDAIDRRSEVNSAIMALRNMEAELDAYILDEMEQRQIQEFKTPRTHVKASVKISREADAERLVPILGGDMVAQYGNIGVMAVDKILKEEELTDEQRSAVKSSIRRKPGKPYIKTTPINPLREED